MVSQNKLRAGLALGLLLLGKTALAGSPAIMCCEDTNGRRICADVLPQACYGKEYREISPQGTVTRVVPAPMTVEERARSEQEDKARKAMEEKARELHRRDNALLQTYSSLDDLEAQRQRAVAEFDKDLTAANRREAELVEQRTKLDKEAKIYAPKPVPPELANQLRDNDSEQAAQRSVIAAKQRDLDAVKLRYDNDRRRYAELQFEKGARR